MRITVPPEHAHPTPHAPLPLRRRKGHIARAAGAAALAAALLIAGRAITAKPPSPGRVAAAAPLVPSSPADAGVEIVYAVSSPNGERSTIAAARALKSAAPRTLFTLDHAEGYPPEGAVARDGSVLALARLPRGARRNDPAELLVIEASSGAQTVADTRADLFAAPVLSPAGDSVFYLRTALAPEPPAEEMRDGRQREVTVELVRYSIAERLTHVLRSETIVDLHLLGVDATTGEPLCVRRTHTGAAVVAVHPETGVLRTIAQPGAGRMLRRATLDAAGRMILLDELALESTDALLLRVPTSGGAPEPLRSVPADDAPTLAASSFLARAPEQAGGAIILDPIDRSVTGPALTIRPLRQGAVEASIMAVSPEGRFLVIRARDGATQAYAIVDAHTGGSRPLPAPAGLDLFGQSASVLGFITRRPQ